MTMHPDPHPPRGIGLHRVHVFEDLPPATPQPLHAERVGMSVASSTPRRSPVWWSLFRHYAAKALIVVAILMIAGVFGTIVTLGAVGVIDAITWLAGAQR